MAMSIPTDEQIQQNVLAELKWEPRVQANEIGVAVKDGVVTLTGWVDSYLKRVVAREAARRVHGVRAVADDTEVRVPSTAERPDPEIAAAAAQVLDWNILVGPEKPAVTVSQGVVALDGDVYW
jgi:osmotically-inducible protein OsmY